MPESRQPSPPPESAAGETPRGGGWLPHGYHLDAHTHADGQLVYAAAGALATTTDRGTWVAPASRVTWTPPRFAHSHRFYGRTDVRLVAILAELCDALAARPSVFAVNPLLREALLALTDRRERRPGAEERLRAVVIALIGEALNDSRNQTSCTIWFTGSEGEARRDPLRLHPIGDAPAGRAAGAGLWRDGELDAFVGRAATGAPLPGVRSPRGQ